MSGHAPGPWEAQEIAPEDPQWGACEIWPANGDRPVATMVCGVDNARLIAAAPELLEALLKLVDSCDDSDGAQYGTLSTSFVRGIAAAAIAKAIGGVE